MNINKHKQKVVVVLPAYNAEKTLEKTFNDIPKGVADLVIMVDDGSNDKTVAVAKKLGIKTFVHPQNRGYGGNQKTCYTLALNEGADIVLMIHPDYQYDSTLSWEMVKPIIDGSYEIMLGSRIRTKKETLAGGMPVYKYYGNRLLTTIQNTVLMQNFSEYHTGYRAFSRDVLKKLPFHKFSDSFVFDQEILISAIDSDFKIGEIPVPVRYFPDSSSISFVGSVKYGSSVLLSLIKFVLHKSKIYSSKIFVRN